MRFRSKVRTLLVLVALTAIVLVTPGEVRARRERRHLARSREFCLLYAVIHEEQRDLCLASRNRTNYDSIERQWSQGGVCYALPVFESWSEEANWHARRASECREAAKQYDRREKAVRRRLILPVLIDIPRNAP
jgi:hypothetical protein